MTNSSYALHYAIIPDRKRPYHVSIQNWWEVSGCRQEMRRWCETNLGDLGLSMDAPWYVDGWDRSIFYFMYERDAMMFLLRWS